MKKSIIIAAFIAFAFQSFAEDCSFIIKNFTNISISGGIATCNNGAGIIAIGDDPMAYNKLAPSETSSLFKTPGSAIFCGVDGLVQFIGEFEHKKYIFNISYNVPYIGDNGYNWNVYATDKDGNDVPTPFYMKQTGNDGGGSNPTVTFEIYGKLTPTPPPPPIVVSKTGNRTITGSFVWNGDTDGMPDASIADWINKAFTIDVQSPNKLLRNLEGTGANSYGGAIGTFCGAQKVGNISFLLSAADASNKQIINYRIANLPEGVPIHIDVVSNVKWNPGKNSKANPGTAFRFMPMILQTTQTSNTLGYTVTCGWTTDLNGKASGATSDVQALIAKLKGSIYSHDADATMGKSFIHADNATSVKATGNLNLQINQAPNTGTRQLDKSKLNVKQN